MLPLAQGSAQEVCFDAPSLGVPPTGPLFGSQAVNGWLTWSDATAETHMALRCLLSKPKMGVPWRCHASCCLCSFVSKQISFV